MPVRTTPYRTSDPTTGIKDDNLAYATMAQGIVDLMEGYAVDQQIAMQSESVERNLKFQEWYTGKQVQDARQRGFEAESYARQMTNVQAANIRAQMAAQGVDVSAGSAQAAQLQARWYGALEADTIRNNAAKEVLGLRMQGAALRGQRNLQRTFGSLQRKASAAKYVAELGGYMIKAYSFFEDPEAQKPKADASPPDAVKMKGRF